MALVTLQTIFQDAFPAYEQTHPLPPHVRRAARAIMQCRTALLGGHIQACPDGHMARVWYNSCRHRACPQCAYLQTERRLAFQQARLLACDHYHVIFTLPHDLNPLWLANVSVMTTLLFQAVRDTLGTLLADPKYLGAQPGILAAPRERLNTVQAAAAGGTMEPEHHIAFGPFRLETTQGRLWRGDHVIALRPRSLAMLSYLVAHPGRLVTKAEVHQHVWAGTHVTDSVLRTSVQEIRAALGDAAAAPRYLATVGRQGYRFLVGGDLEGLPPLTAGPWWGARATSRLWRSGSSARLRGPASSSSSVGERAWGRRRWSRCS
jgi:hypothetical protein